MFLLGLRGEDVASIFSPQAGGGLSKFLSRAGPPAGAILSAELHTQLGNKDEAFRLSEKAFKDRVRFDLEHAHRS